MDQQQRAEAQPLHCLLDASHEPQFNEFTLLAASLCQTGHAVIALTDGTLQWFGSASRPHFSQTAHEALLDAEVVRQAKLGIIPDADCDPRFTTESTPDDTSPRFYAGAPLIAQDGTMLGMLAIMDHARTKCCGAHPKACLARMPRRRLSSEETVSPKTFIPLAEKTGLIVPIGEWVLHTACAHNKTLQRLGLPPIGVAVNISARQFDPKTPGASISHVLD